MYLTVVSLNLARQMAGSCWDRIDGGLCVSAFLRFEHLSSSGLGTEPRGSLSGDGRPKIKDVNIKRPGNVCHDHLFPEHTILTAGTEPSAPPAHSQWFALLRILQSCRLGQSNPSQLRPSGARYPMGGGSHPGYTVAWGL